MIRESHSGLSFEEYRDCCVFLSFYQYLCMRYKEQIPKELRLKSLAHMTLRGKLQMNSFQSFMEKASDVFSKYEKRIHLREFSFWGRVTLPHSGEKQRCFARFIRKWIKKLYYLEEDGTLTYENYSDFFSELITEFSDEKKGTMISEEIQELYRMFASELDENRSLTVFQPQFQYAILLNNIKKEHSNTRICGYETKSSYLDILRVASYMDGTFERIQVFLEEQWFEEKANMENSDLIFAYYPNGISTGCRAFSEENEFLSSNGSKLNFSKSKQELPFLLSMFSSLNKNGEMIAVVPKAMLYREGTETALRRYMIEEKNWLDTAILLPGNLFEEPGQENVFLYFKKVRKDRRIFLLDYSDRVLSKEEIVKIREIYEGKVDVPSFGKFVTLKEVRTNEFNLNFPRYIVKKSEERFVDLEEKRKKVQEINQKITDLEDLISMYRQDFSIR